MYQLSQETGFLLQRGHRRYRALLIEALEPFHIGIGHFAVLGVVSFRGPLTQQQLIEVLEIDKSSMVYLVDELERQSLAERRPVPGDRRAYAIHLTTQGMACVAEAGVAAQRVKERFLGGLTATERSTLNDLLSRIAT